MMEHDYFPHFPVYEFDQRAHRHLPHVQYPEAWIEPRLNPLRTALEILRAELGGHSVIVISGYRTPELNRILPGASKNSQHMEGRAADIVVAGLAPDVVHDAALMLARAGKLGIGGLGRYPSFTHIDVRPGARLARWTGR